ncbi:asparaginase [Aurantimonas endophytica]|uniref:L-asparaginase II n=1 Tax=Aurantimonas endophytica TaxID=1522175 RepID=A0A7W6HHC3_9HYPH|nr:asparaginase [Aurantimonas endophytica]MBB4004962.1 L-asparaginase II [Aurantimonas endophytica]MCO6405768.1 asparaginase [Aurantimonas endophytica]
MANPVLVEVTRGEMVESFHRGAFALMDGEGRLLASAGDVDRPVFPRSTIKVFQAIPLIETGAAAAFQLSPAELALACASHSGETGHVRQVAAMLAKAGLDASALECGCHWPFDAAVARDLARRGETPTALHNNCSGKHAGFLCTAVHRGEDTRGYVGRDHPVQLRAKAVIEELVGQALTVDACGIDGCSIPTFAAPLKGFAHGFAKLVSGHGISPQRAAAGRSLIDACMAHPWEMSGTGRFCETLMGVAPGRVFAKTGVEGVFCGALPDLGLGFALKIDDGATRASEALAAAVIATALRDEDAALAGRFEGLARRTLSNWEKVEVGEIRVTMPA